MNRIIEAFTRAHDQVTAIDQAIITGTAILVVGVIIVSVLITLWAVDKLK